MFCSHGNPVGACVPLDERFQGGGLQDAHQDAGGRVPAVVFQVELALEGVEDGLDGLAERFEEAFSGPLAFAFAGAAEQGDPRRGQLSLELGVVVALSAIRVCPGEGCLRAGSACSRSSST